LGRIGGTEVRKKYMGDHVCNRQMWGHTRATNGYRWVQHTTEEHEWAHLS